MKWLTSGFIKEALFSLLHVMKYLTMNKQMANMKGLQISESIRTKYVIILDTEL